MPRAPSSPARAQSAAVPRKPRPLWAPRATPPVTSPPWKRPCGGCRPGGSGPLCDASPPPAPAARPFRASPPRRAPLSAPCPAAAALPQPPGRAPPPRGLWALPEAPRPPSRVGRPKLRISRPFDPPWAAGGRSRGAETPGLPAPLAAAEPALSAHCPPRTRPRSRRRRSQLSTRRLRGLRSPAEQLLMDGWLARQTLPVSSRSASLVRASPSAPATTPSQRTMARG
mmetsp:Transcript_31299/g.100118  ORF Transcript_31299/g.100118 Transcript_31299/m.100118 type:complete len:227 (-) Transcript_31299:120-800(-)